MRNQITISYKTVAPCKECQERKEACHAACEKYKRWKQENDESFKAYHEKKMADRRVRESLVEGKIRNSRMSAPVAIRRKNKNEKFK